MCSWPLGGPRHGPKELLEWCAAEDGATFFRLTWPAFEPPLGPHNDLEGPRFTSSGHVLQMAPLLLTQTRS